MSLVCGLSLPIDCDTCYETVIIEPCLDATINFPLNLTPAASLYLFVIDKFRNIWCDLITVNSDGGIDIVVADYPDGLFNKNAGIFRIFLSTDITGSDVVDITIGSETYPCLVFGFCYAN